MSIAILSVALGKMPLYAQIGPSSVDEPDIRGGHESEPDAWPWQVALVYSYSDDAYYGQFCGGTLIAPEWVLTAAHCVEYTYADSIHVVLGRHQLSANDEGERVAVSDIVVYPDYVSAFDGGDLALLRLSEPSTRTVVAFDTNTVDLVEERSLNATVSGWGATDALGSGSDVLREVVLPFVSLETCRAAYYFDDIADEMVCAGYAKGAKSACYGDSGGPLVIPRAEAPGWTQVGIVSWGRGSCSGFNNYNVYTRVASYSDWIQSCLSGAPGSHCVTGDSYEPDNDVASATLISTDGISQTHNFEGLEDSDWLKFEAKAGTQYWIDTFDLGEDSDTILWIYAADGVTALAYNDDDIPYNGARSVIFWTAPADDTYYIQVDNHWQGQQSGTEYSVRVVTVTDELYLPTVYDNHQWAVAVEVPPIVLTIVPTLIPVVTPTPIPSLP
ncbi:MAG: trypsin-like serine protease [Caldilineaceae bacterium]